MDTVTPNRLGERASGLKKTFTESLIDVEFNPI